MSSNVAETALNKINKIEKLQVNKIGLEVLRNEKWRLWRGELSVLYGCIDQWGFSVSVLVCNLLITLDYCYFLIKHLYSITSIILSVNMLYMLHSS